MGRGKGGRLNSWGHSTWGQYWGKRDWKGGRTKDDTQNFRLSDWVNSGAPNQKWGYNHRKNSSRGKDKEFSQGHTEFEVPGVCLSRSLTPKEEILCWIQGSRRHQPTWWERLWALLRSREKDDRSRKLIQRLTTNRSEHMFHLCHLLVWQPWARYSNSLCWRFGFLTCKITGELRWFFLILIRIKFVPFHLPLPPTFPITNGTEEKRSLKWGAFKAVYPTRLYHTT